MSKTMKELKEGKKILKDPKIKKVENKKKINKTESSWFIDNRNGLTSLICFSLLFVLRGGYFYYESLLIGSVGIILMAYCLLRYGYLWLPAEKRLFPLLVMYLIFGITFFWATDKGMHGFVVLKLISPLLFFAGVASLEKRRSVDGQVSRRLISSFFNAYALVSLATLVMALVRNSDFISPMLKESLPLVMINGRFTGLFQYANVNGILAGLALLYGLERSNYRIWPVFFGMVMALTGSRAAWLLSLAFMVLTMGGAIWRTTNHRKQQIINKFSYFLLAGAGFATGLIIYYYFNQTTRLAVNFQASELQARFLYYKDALRMILANPFGYGGGGYYQVQRFYQTGATYRVRYIHSHFLQIAVDGGLPMLFSYLFFLGQNLFKDRKLYFGIGIFRLLMLGLLLAHSLFDFDFQFTSSYLLLFLLLFDDSVMVTLDFSGKQRREISVHRFKKAYRWVVLGLFIIYPIVAFPYAMAAYHQYQFDIEKALTYRPMMTDAKVERLADQSLSLVERRKTAESLITNSLKNVEGIAFLRDYYYNNGDFRRSIDYGHQAVLQAPLWIEQREALAACQWALIDQYLVASKAEQARLAEAVGQARQEILALPTILTDLEEERSSQLKVQHKPVFKMTDTLLAYYKAIKALDKGKT